jgi:DNA invertase Pin-like site-specific DNA recombinase
LPISWMLTTSTDDTGRMTGALNAMMLDVLAAIARKDYGDRRRRQKQGIEKLKAAGGRVLIIWTGALGKVPRIRLGNQVDSKEESNRRS